MAGQVLHVQRTIGHGLKVSVIGKRETPSMREWPRAPSQPHIANFSSARPWVAGIAPGKDGAYSVCLSGGHEDDVDEGYALSVLSISVIPLHLTRTNPQHIHRFGRKGPQGNQDCTQERTLFIVSVSQPRMTSRDPWAVENCPTIIRPDFRKQLQ